MGHDDLELEKSSSDQELDLASPHRRRRQQLLILVSCSTLTFTGCGINFAFGVYQELYQSLDGPFQDARPGDIDFIGTLSASLMTIAAPIASALSKAYGARSVVILAAICFAVSGIAASFGSRLWHFQLFQGVLQGLAACFTYIPAVTISPKYFKGKGGLAMGIITSGTGFGGMLWAPLLRYFISAYGFRNTLRICGLLAAVMITLAAIVLRSVGESSPQESQQVHGSRNHLENARMKTKTLDLVRSQEFIAHASGTAFQAAAYMIPIYFMSLYAGTLGYNNTAGANLIALSDACNSGGKIIIGYYADRIGKLNALVMSTFASATATFAMCFLSDTQISNTIHRALFIIYACVYGITAGAYVSLFPAALVEQFGIADFTRLSGLLYMIRGMGTLIGTPLGGFMVRHSTQFKEVSSSFDRMFLFVAFLLLSATASVTWARSLKVP